MRWRAPVQHDRCEYKRIVRPIVNKLVIIVKIKANESVFAAVCDIGHLPEGNCRRHWTHKPTTHTRAKDQLLPGQALVHYKKESGAQETGAGIGHRASGIGKYGLSAFAVVAEKIGGQYPHSLGRVWASSKRAYGARKNLVCISECAPL
jgi:hypothetical protein